MKKQRNIVTVLMQDTYRMSQEQREKAGSVTGITLNYATFALARAQKRYEAALNELKAAEALQSKVDEHYKGPLIKVEMDY